MSGSVQRFRCVPWISGSSRILPPPLESLRAEVDVLDRRKRIALGIEPAGGAKRVRADRPEPGPERRRLAGALLVDVVVQEVPKLRDDARIGRHVVVGAEDRRQRRIRLERRADAGERVGVREHVRVDEDDDVTGRVLDARRSARPPGRRLR